MKGSYDDLFVCLFIDSCDELITAQDVIKCFRM